MDIQMDRWIDVNIYLPVCKEKCKDSTLGLPTKQTIVLRIYLNLWALPAWRVRRRQSFLRTGSTKQSCFLDIKHAQSTLFQSVQIIALDVHVLGLPGEPWRGWRKRGGGQAFRNETVHHVTWTHICACFVMFGLTQVHTLDCEEPIAASSAPTPVEDDDVAQAGLSTLGKAQPQESALHCNSIHDFGI